GGHRVANRLERCAWPGSDRLGAYLGFFAIGAGCKRETAVRKHKALRLRYRWKVEVWGGLLALEFERIAFALILASQPVYEICEERPEKIKDDLRHIDGLSNLALHDNLRKEDLAGEFG